MLDELNLACLKKGLQEFFGIIRRAIVYHDDFIVRISLLKNALQGRFNKRGPVISWDDNGEEWGLAHFMLGGAFYRGSFEMSAFALAGVPSVRRQRAPYSYLKKATYLKLSVA